MYKSVTFPVVATDEVRFENFAVSVDPTFACVVVESEYGHDVFRYDEEALAFVFVCATVVEGGVELVPEMSVIQEALWELMPWLAEEVSAVRQAWIEFFDGTRQMPMLSVGEKEMLSRHRMLLVAGVSEGGGKQKRAIKPVLELVCA